MRYYVEVDAPGKPAEKFEVSKGAGSIGSGPSDVVFVDPSTGLPPCAIQIQVEEAAVELEAQGSVVLNHAGAESQCSTVKWGNDVYVQGICLSMLAEGGDKKATSPLVWVLLVLVLLLGAGLMVDIKPADADAAAPAKIHLEQPTQPSCAAKTKEEALSKAAEFGRRADAKAERYPFARGEGLLALQLRAEQEACLLMAGEAQAEQRAARERQNWSRRLGQDFQSLEASFHLEMEDGRFQEALDALLGLESFLNTSSSKEAQAYLAWIRTWKENLQWKVGERRRQ